MCHFSLYVFVIFFFFAIVSCIYLFLFNQKRLSEIKNLLQECSGQNGQQYISFITSYYNTDRLETLKNSYMSLSQFPFAKYTFCNFNVDCRRFQSDGAAYKKAFLPNSDRTKGTETTDKDH